MGGKTALWAVGCLVAISGAYAAAGMGAWAADQAPSGAVLEIAPRSGPLASTPVVQRINVGENAGFTITPSCFDRKGRKVIDPTRFFVKGAPDTGGATAEFRPNPQSTFKTTTLVITTTEDTRPGQYVMTISAQGRRCPSAYPSVERTLNLAPIIRGKRTVWFFDKEEPAGYDTSLRLTAHGPGGEPYSWFFTRGGGKAVVARRIANSALIEGLKESDAEGDISIRVESGGVESDPLELTVRSPERLRLNVAFDKPDPRWGYRSTVNWILEDQFGKDLPSPVPIHQRWTSRVFKDRITNWERPDAKGAVVGDRFNDVIFGNLSLLPDATAPQKPLGTEEVIHWEGEWRVGHARPGTARGTLVSRNRWQLYRDHARAPKR